MIATPEVWNFLALRRQKKLGRFVLIPNTHRRYSPLKQSSSKHIIMGPSRGRGGAGGTSRGGGSRGKGNHHKTGTSARGGGGRDRSSYDSFGGNGDIPSSAIDQDSRNAEEEGDADGEGARKYLFASVELHEKVADVFFPYAAMYQQKMGTS